MIKQQITKLINKYNGTMRFIKETMFRRTYGEENYKQIFLMTAFLDEKIDKGFQNEITFHERLYCILHDITSLPKCKTCGNDVTYVTSLPCMEERYSHHCSYSCRGKNQDVQNKKKQTNLKKYGTTNVLASEQVKQKVRKDNLEKYGVTSYTQTEEYRQRIKDGDIKRCRSAEGMEQVINSNYSRAYNNILINFKDIVTPLFTLEQYTGVGYATEYKWRCCKCQTEFIYWYMNGLVPKCPKCYKGTSIERFVGDILLGQGIEFSTRIKTILKNQYQLDFYIPSKKIAIETDGLFWHNDERLSKESHLKKLEECKQLGISLFRIFEDEIKYKPEIVKSRLLNILGKTPTTIYARNCDIKEITNQECTTFLIANHLQGNCQSKYKIGLLYNNEIVAVMTFSNYRLVTGFKKSIANEYELARFANKININVVGGFSRLLSYFEKTYKPIKIISYCDKRWSNGNVYSSNGFTHVKDTAANYWYIIPDCKARVHRFVFRKSELSKLLETYDPNLTEAENMKNNKYRRIWDFGNMLFLKTY